MRNSPKNMAAGTTPCPIESILSHKRGRPPAAMAAKVEERILDSAAAMFLEHGFGGTSLERIAVAAGAGKATLYSRYSNKDALFSAVVERSCERGLLLVFEAPQSAALAQRLVLVTRALVTRLLNDEVIGLIRIVVADGPRFPSLVKLTSEASRSHAIEAVATMIEEHSRRTVESQTRAASKRQSRALATQILDAVFAPMLIRALLGENLDDLRSDIRSHVKKTIALFVASKTLDAFL